MNVGIVIIFRWCKFYESFGTFTSPCSVFALLEIWLYQQKKIAVALSLLRLFKHHAIIQTTDAPTKINTKRCSVRHENVSICTEYIGAPLVEGPTLDAEGSEGKPNRNYKLITPHTNGSRRLHTTSSVFVLQRASVRRAFHTQSMISYQLLLTFNRVSSGRLSFARLPCATLF